MSQTKLEIISEKIRPYITTEIQTGRLPSKDFKDLIKSIAGISPSEHKYIAANFRRVVTNLSLYHYLPEIESNEEVVILQMANVIISRWVSNGEVLGRKQAIDKIIKWQDERLQEGFLTNVSDEQRIKNLISEIRTQIAYLWNNNQKNKIPKSLERFRDDISELSTSSQTVLYDISMLARDVKSNKIMFLDNIQDKIDEWDERLTVKNIDK